MKLIKNINIKLPIRTMMISRNFSRISVSLSLRNKPLILNYLRLHPIDRNHLSNEFFNKTDKLSSSLIKVEKQIVSKPLLLTADSNKNFNSGLMTLSLQEKNYFEGNNIEEAQLYIKIVNFLIAKVLLALYGVSENITLYKKFDLIFNSFGLDLNALPKYLSNKKCITMLQHILVYVCHDKQLSYETLKNFAYPINCESYKGQEIKILAFIEAYVIKKNLLKNNVDKPFITYYLVNPDNLQAIPGFFPLESMQQAAQRNTDLFAITINSNLIQKYYADVKTYVTAGFFHKNLLSIWFFNKKDFLKELNNVKTTLQVLIKNNHNNKSNLQDLLIEIEELKIDKKDNQLIQEQKAIRLHELLVEFKMDNTNENILIALNMPLMFSAICGYENAFLNILNKIISRIDQQHHSDNVNLMFPSTTEIDKQQRLKFLNDFVQNHFQDDPELKQEILNNINSQLCIQNS